MKTDRRDSRELALQALFQNEFNVGVSFSDFLSLYEEKFSPEVIAYAKNLAEGCSQRKEDLDQLISTHSRHWSLARMALVEKNILRIAIFEMKFSTTPLKPSVVIDEAIEITKKYGSTEGSSFINGVLDSVAKQ